MTAQMTTQQLREELTAHLDSITPPPGDLDAVRRRSRQAKVRRTTGPALLAVAAVGVGALVLTQTTGPSNTSDRSDGDVAVADGPVDVSDGLRAYASPGEKIYLGGRQLPYDVPELDTDAAATPYGIAYYDDDGWPSLLRPDGSHVQLDVMMAEPRPTAGFSPTIKADSLRPHVAFALLRGNDLELGVYDLEKQSVVASHVVTCPDGCSDRVIDGIDSGAVFLRGEDGTTIWDYENGERYLFAGPGTKVADVRNGVVLYDGPTPTGTTDRWRLVSGAIDAQLTFDGEHVLYWSSTLEPTRPRGEPIVLDAGSAEGGLGWWAVDTDGSILVAEPQVDGKVFTGQNIVYDCELPSGRCEKLGPLDTPSGDPLFIGVDM